MIPFRDLLIQQARNARQLLTFQELQRSTAAGGNMRHLIGEAELLDRSSDMDLRDLFIVSECLISEDADEEDAVSGVGSANPELKISVREAPGVKCPRCWMHSLKADPETGLCPRCADVVSKL